VRRLPVVPRSRFHRSQGRSILGTKAACVGRLILVVGKQRLKAAQDARLQRGGPVHRAEAYPARLS
jgi:hypothetical protein